MMEETMMEKAVEIEFTLNGKPQVLQTDESMPLLWALRDRL